MKEKRTLLQSIKKDFLKGLRRIYWYTFTKINYYYLTTLFGFKKKKISSYKITLVCPTRERINKFKRMVESLMKTVNDPKNIELLILLDSDDPELDSYKIESETINKKGLATKLYIIDLDSNSKRINYLVYKSVGDIIFTINDDISFLSKDWDHYINKEFSKINIDKPFCLWITSDVKYNYLHCDFPIINRSWYETLGYHSSEYFAYWYLDAWICDLCFRSKKFLVTDLIKINQFSANKYKDEIDNTHLKNIGMQKTNNDHKTWVQTKNIRISESNKLTQ